MVLAVRVPLLPSQKRSPLSYIHNGVWTVPSPLLRGTRPFAAPSLLGNRLKHVGLDGDLRHLGLTKVSAAGILPCATLWASDLSQWYQTILVVEPCVEITLEETQYMEWGQTELPCLSQKYRNSEHLVMPGAP